VGSHEEEDCGVGQGDNVTAQEIEQLLAGPLGIRSGTRGNVNDSDSIRSNDPKQLVRALTKVLSTLSQRVHRVEKPETKFWIEKTLRDFEDIKNTLEKRSDEVTGASVFLLWGASATALHWVHVALKEHGA
jgi:hypothetical protein